MKSPKMTLFTLVAMGLVSMVLTGCEGSDSGGGTSDNPPSTAVNVTAGNYASACTAIGGSVHGATYYMALASFGSSGYSYTEMFFSDSACHSELYVLSGSGTYTVGSPTNAPAGGYKITFIPANMSLTSYDGTSSTSINSVCGTNLSGSATANAPSMAILSSGLTCGGGSLGLSAPGTPAYNVFVQSGSLLMLGSRTENNPGVGADNLVSTTTNLNLVKY